MSLNWEPIYDSQESLWEDIEKLDTVLVIEDDVMIQGMIELILKMNGYKVLIASNWVEWIDTYKENMKKVVLVILDVTFDGKEMQWDEIFKELRIFNNKVKIIVSTGDVINLPWDLRSANEIVKKPLVGVENFLETLKRVINQ